MTDWVRKQIEAAKQRHRTAQRKVDPRGLDGPALLVQRAAVWDSLRERLGNAVGEFNEGMSLARPLQFTKKSDDLVYVTKEDFPSYSFSVQIQQTLDRIQYSLSRSDRPSTPMHAVRQETLVFDVDEDGQFWLMLGDQRLNVDEVAELMLVPIFDSVS